MSERNERLTTAQKLLSVDNRAADRIIVPVRVRDVQYAEPLKYEIESEKKIYFSKEKAFEFLELETFEGEREVRQTHVQFLFDEWMAGRFLWHNVTLASAVLGNKEYRINGQHTSWMRVNVPDSKEPVEGAQITFRRYKVKDAEQLRAIYSAFDRNAPRTVGHITKVLLIDSAAGHEIPGSYFPFLAAGFRLFQYPSGSKGYQVSLVEMLETIKQKYETLFQQVGLFFTNHYSDCVWMRRSSVVGGMFSTFDKGLKVATEFWTPVVTGLELDEKTDPRYRLRAFMESHGHTAARGKEHVGAEQAFRICLIAWNHWREGNEVQKFYIPRTDLDRPKVKS